jgi:hypothetical protein
VNDDVEARRDLEAAARVHAARRAIDDAIAELAARPLDERAADRMRAVLAAPGLRQARSALRRLAAAATATAASPRRARLSVVAPDRGEEPAEAEEPDRVMGGAA